MNNMKVYMVSNNAIALSDKKKCWVVVKNSKRNKQFLWVEVSKIYDNDFKENEHPRDKNGQFTSKGGGEGSVSKPEKSVEKSSKKGSMKGVMEKLSEYKNKGAGSYSYETGEPVEKSEGYFVSFHQNEPDENGDFKSHFGGYSKDGYDKEANSFIYDNELEPVIGNYDTDPELSGWTMDRKKAMELAEKHNQLLIWDCKRGKEILNIKYDAKKNPMRKEKND